MGGISIWQLLIIVLLVVVLFGGGKLRGIGAELGESIRAFRKSMDDSGDKSSDNKNLVEKKTDQDEKKS